MGGRHPTATPEDIIALIWKLHVGINNASPPHFDANQDHHITNNGLAPGHGVAYPKTQQWLMWASPRPNPAAAKGVERYWNDAACIGYVQLLKTMAASVGLFARRTWVFPHTAWWPNGLPVTYVDTDLYALGSYSRDHVQKWSFPKVSPTGLNSTIDATVVLMEQDGGWENFEACCRSPNGRFLPGGYPIHSVTRRAPFFVKHRGFASALELLRWWGKTDKNGFQRFQCWAGWETITLPSGQALEVRRYWDVGGNPYALPGVPYNGTNFVWIRDRKKDLPLP